MAGDEDNARRDAHQDNVNQPNPNINANDHVGQNSGSNFIRPPKPLVVSGDIATAWKLWLQQYEYFEAATQMETKPAKVQVGTFMASIGVEAVVVFNTFQLTEVETADIAVIKDRFKGYFTPKSNTTYERYTFNKMMQVEGESFDEFLTKLKSQSGKCQFANLHDSLLTDKIIIGLRNDKVRERLLSEDEITLDRTISICRASELTSKQLKVLRNNEGTEVNAIQKYKKNSGKSSSGKSSSTTATTDETYECSRCGKRHGPKSCPAFKQKCSKCKRKGHFADMCRIGKNKKKVHLVEESSDNESDNEEFYVNTIQTNKDDAKNWIEEIDIEQVKVNVKLDSGAQCNVLPKRIADKMKKALQTSRIKRIITFSGHNMKVAGEIVVLTTIRKKVFTLKFIVVDEDVTPILGKAGCELSGLIVRVQELKSKEKSVFDGLGCLKDFVYDIDFIEHPTFEIHAARRIPHAYRQLVKEELDSMVKSKVIKPVTEATPAVSPMVVVKQKGKIRICIDPTDVNKNVIRRHYPLTTIEEIATRIAGSKIFTKLDCRKGFWQIKLSERTQKYLTFATPWGRYSCLKLPFGLCSAPEIFQQIMSQLLSDINKAEASMDDILIYAEDINELRRIQETVIKRLADAGLTLNKEKCVFEVKKLKFLGHVISANGMELDPEKVQAIEKLKTPENKTELQRLLGMVTYLAKFIPNMSEITHPLRKLLEKDAEWLWTPEQARATDQIKTVLSSPPVLRFYNVNERVTLQVDASSYALGAAILQKQQPVAYASRSLTKTECRYPQIEKEALAIRFACSKFHEYIYGKELTIETDHKPLEAIFKKPICNAPPRLQRILMDVASYSPEVIYRKGETMYLADILSRDCDNPAAMEQDEFQVLSLVSISDNATTRLQEETKKDSHLQEVLKYVLAGWPTNQAELPPSIKPYWNYRDELSTFNGLLYKGQKVVIPAGQKRKTLEQIHLGHFGIQRTLSAAREHVFWINMSKDITEYVEKCKICQASQKSKQSEPLIVKPVPKLPFEIVATDIFTFQLGQYLLIVDSYSGYFDFKILKSITSKEVIKNLKTWFAVHGIPRLLESDNGPQFASKEFKDFTTSWQFEHRTSSPRYPKSNGLAERFVQTAKSMLKKCFKDGSDEKLALLNYRNTPRNDKIGSPNQRLMSRTTRSILPATVEQLKPKIVSGVEQQLIDIRNQQKLYHDRGAKEAPQIQVGDKVRVQRGKRDWIGATVVQNTDKPRSLIVQTQNGKKYRRNTIHLYPTKAEISDPPSVAVSPQRAPDERARSTITHSPKPSPQPIVDDSAQQRTFVQPSVGPDLNKVTGNETNHQQRTRYGRLVKKVVKMNL